MIGTNCDKWSSGLSTIAQCPAAKKEKKYTKESCTPENFEQGLPENAKEKENAKKKMVELVNGKESDRNHSKYCNNSRYEIRNLCVFFSV